ncbi:MurR/RpiR family transcriptional regulator [Furfurilactobacillus cerevisiae]|uniref:MurR/RpiR family transcriptional regulator n=1 Tax=Furfurilactobacillus rossiae TaxID=231049 RepID=UPI003B97F858
MNFFEIVSTHLQSLTDNERKLFDYIVKNMGDVQEMSIREVSATCFVSTATFLRFVRKIGFSGYSEFITVLKFTTRDNASEARDQANNQFVVNQSSYREDFLKNIEETVHVLRPEVLHQITAKLSHTRTIFIFARGLSKSAARYITNLYQLAGFNVSFPEDQLYRRAAMDHITAEDLILIIDYTGEEVEFVNLIQQVFKEPLNRPMVLSITGADNNTIQNLSDINLYTFFDQIRSKEGVEISSRVTAIVIMELILYQWLDE